MRGEETGVCEAGCAKSSGCFYITVYTDTTRNMSQLVLVENWKPRLTREVVDAHGPVDE